jgi:hypothetical protein
MNRIDHRPAALPLNSTDGAQLQRHVLQELERQWLDSWGTASAAQGDSAPMPQSPESQPFGSRSRPTEGASAHDVRAEASAGSTQPGSRSAAPSSRQPGESGTEAAAAEPNTTAPSTHGRAGAAPVIDSMPGEEGREPEADMSPVLPLGAVAGVWRAPLMAVSPDAAGSAPSGLAAVAATSATQPALVLAAPGARLAPNSEPDEAGTSAAPARQKPRPAHQADGDLGSNKLTLRELAPDLIQATLRDTQLGHAASRLAAQGLARALMEAGYAQARVVVNGQSSRSEPAEGEDSPPTATSPSPFTATALKDSIHGN